MRALIKNKPFYIQNVRHGQPLSGEELRHLFGRLLHVGGLSSSDSVPRREVFTRMDFHAEDTSGNQHRRPSSPGEHGLSTHRRNVSVLISGTVF